ncbi:low molecular weight protein-tyrosine-phosphatase [Deinococcus cellulosilyticus]|uniref:protein-tyrosine-phosphatase n=1 Tax=Deinococcus cellulosilyticus (strain DSM 18568 / NBRC 106333 / KACC 11606 / 5516J-15) TaxID=1223518 RepID=A0A511N4R7_DEIC1|nr:low molecular weight protein-tyrosine-phosphatase [Deinococcus cellulosilyticus]GEM47426.1 phosphotyrosine protein phosphatase [Deinococcus cellulosilyticus NBRC 106333 = KACC 11606]
MKVLTVCLGNICRSPLAEVLVRKAFQDAGIEATVDSAGTGDWHLGELPDPRARKVAADHGIALTHPARQLSAQDFSDFDHILVMDEQNLRTVKKLQPTTSKARVKMIRDFDPLGKGAVPDPYYGTDEDFQVVWTMLERAANGFAASVAEQQTVQL